MFSTVSDLRPFSGKKPAALQLFKDALQKSVQLIRFSEKSSTLSLRCHGRRRTAEIKINLPITQRSQLIHGPEKIIRIFCKDLRNCTKPDILCRAYVFLLFILHGMRCVSCNERQIISVDTAEVMCVCAPVNMAGDSFHGSKINVVISSLVRLHAAPHQRVIDAHSMGLYAYFTKTSTSSSVSNAAMHT